MKAIRPTVSMRGDLHAAFVAECERRGVSMASVVTGWVDALDVPAILVSNRIRSMLTVRCARDQLLTGRLMTEDELAEELILRALTAEG